MDGTNLRRPGSPAAQRRARQVAALKRIAQAERKTTADVIDDLLDDSIRQAYRRLRLGRYQTPEVDNLYVFEAVAR